MSKWIKSSFSIPNGCVEVSFDMPDMVMVRDDGAPGIVIMVSNADWGSFLRGVRNGEFDRPGTVITTKVADLSGTNLQALQARVVDEVSTPAASSLAGTQS